MYARFTYKKKTIKIKPLSGKYANVPYLPLVFKKYSCSISSGPWYLILHWYFQSIFSISLVHPILHGYSQWSFLVPLIGGRYPIITQLAVYTTYILPIGWLYITYHLLREPETAIEYRMYVGHPSHHQPSRRCHFRFGTLTGELPEKFLSCFRWTQGFRGVALVGDEDFFA